MDKNRYSLKPIADDKLPLPTEELMQYGIENDVLESPGLMMHVVLSRIVTLAMIKKIQEHGEPIREDVAMVLNTAYHATRQKADFGRTGQSTNDVNGFMQKHDDMDFALEKAIAHTGKNNEAFDEYIIQGIKDFRRNPKTRELYFPNETLEKNGIMNGTETIPMLTSRLIAGPICTIEDRFVDLKTRRSEEIGKLELLYFKEHIEAGDDITIPKPLLETAKKDSEFAIHNEDDFKSLVVSGKIDGQKMGFWVLDGYEEGCKKAINEFCKICQIDNFYDWLKSDVQVVKDESKKSSIEKEFKKYLGRGTKPDEFVPYLPGIELLYKRIARIKEEMGTIQKIKKGGTN